MYDIGDLLRRMTFGGKDYCIVIEKETSPDGCLNYYSVLWADGIITGYKEGELAIYFEFIS